MSNEQAKRFLQGIYQVLMSAMPIEGDFLEPPKRVDPRFTMTIGFAAGAISEGLHAEAEDRALQISDRGRHVVQVLVEAIDNHDLAGLDAARDLAKGFLRDGRS